MFDVALDELTLADILGVQDSVVNATTTDNEQEDEDGAEARAEA
jgi:hypothetical protein